MASPVAILTDFGHADPFVGIMKGVIARISPASTLIDLVHEIPPGDLRRAALALWQSAPYFPTDTVFLVVVDPGVGTDRRAVIARGPGGQVFVGPDNGVFSFVLPEDAPAWELKNPDLALPNPSQTFHGRDVFAPAAGYAALGMASAGFGPTVDRLVRLPLPLLAAPRAGVLEGEILHADHYGNLLTSLGRFVPGPDPGSLALEPWIPGVHPMQFKRGRVRLYLPENQHPEDPRDETPRSLPYASTFGEIPAGEAAFLVGSTGLLEIAANRQSAADLLGLAAGDKVRLASLRL